MCKELSQPVLAGNFLCCTLVEADVSAGLFLYDNVGCAARDLVIPPDVRC